MVYTTRESAERAMEELHGKRTIPGVPHAIQCKLANSEIAASTSVASCVLILRICVLSCVLMRVCPCAAAPVPGGLGTMLVPVPHSGPSGACVPYRVSMCTRAYRVVSAGEFKLFVGMLAQTTTEENLQQLFKAYGTVLSTAVLRHKYVTRLLARFRLFCYCLYLLRDTGASRGCGFVTFAHRQSGLDAIEALHQKYQLNGATKPLIVQFSDTRTCTCCRSRSARFSLICARVAIAAEQRDSRRLQKMGIPPAAASMGGYGMAPGMPGGMGGMSGMGGMGGYGSQGTVPASAFRRARHPCLSFL